MDSMQKEKLVGIKCLTYNHESTIRQTLDGFISQKTDFPFEVIVHDDASTDKTAEIIREYAEKYPDIIKPILQKKNLYQNSPPGTIGKIMDDVLKDYKYIAICEGDDYWISPDKLQRQVSFLEENPEYTMCCTDAVILTPNGKERWQISKTDTDLTIENLIIRGGLYFATAGIIYRSSVRDNYPPYCLRCGVGDHPLQIMCGLKGKVRYFSEQMVAYRFSMGNSWTATRKKQDIDKLMTSWKGSINMLEGLNEYSHHQYETAFRTGQLEIILRNAGNHLEYAKYILEEMLKLCPDCIKYAHGKDKLKLFLIRHNLTFLWSKLKK